MMSYAFGKKDKLCSVKLIGDVFAKGEEIKSYPYVLKYIRLDEVDFNIQIAVSVPKKRIRKATARNLIRRRIKEAYRLNRVEFIEAMKSKNISLAIFLVYIGKENESYQFIQQKIKLLLKELIKRFSS